ncbi:MAG: histone deacetylase [Halobacteriales archaeon]|nr:histone deacetylase [Halobacteriales archaeon]
MRTVRTGTDADADVALVYHDDYLLHEHTPTHPERRERLTYTMDQLREEGVFEHPAVERVEPERVEETEMGRVHTDDYIEELKRMSSEGRGALSVDTHVSKHTWESALLAAGGVVEGVERVLDGENDASFVMSRPGGHHAFADHGHGFCFTNNTAVALRRAQETHGVEKILLWDWDAHHFDGTQSIFYDDASVLTMSTHQTGRTLFPGTGYADEVGEGEGEGYNVNVPLLPKTGDEGYARVVEEVFEPIARQYDPDLLFVEAGQDCHFTDPITDLGVTARGYVSLMDTAVETADSLCDGRVVASLAGGYGIEGGLPYTNLAVIASLADMDTSNVREPATYEPPSDGPDVGRVIENVKQNLDGYWDFD